MKPLHLLVAGAAVFAVPAFAQSAGAGPRMTLPGPAPIGGFNTGHHGFGGGVWVIEREVPVYVERDTPATTGTPNRDVPVVPAAPRKPYVLGASYDSLPGSCLKLIEDGASFYYCDGDWYRQVGEGRSVSYKAVARKL